MAILHWLGQLFHKLRVVIRRFDKSMRDKYRPAALAAITLFVLLALISVILFFPPYLGLSNDGSFDQVLSDTGLVRLDEDDTGAYFNYYERVYRLDSSRLAAGTTPALLKTVVFCAKAVDHFFTPDNYFDMRFLAAIYVALYMLVLYPLLLSLLKRARVFSEGLVISVIFVLIFGDVSHITYFASLYTVPLIWLLLIAVVDMCYLIASREGHGIYPYLTVVFLAMLMQINRYCAMAGIAFSMAYWKMVRLNTHVVRRTVFVICAFLMCMLSVVTTVQLVSSQTKVQKYNQMTRGVLFQALDPEKALGDFGIEPRYSVLTETYAEQAFPVVLPSSGVLDEGFFDKYDTPKVAFYYMRHPGSLIGLYDVAVNNAFNMRSDYSGNYERSAGMPEKAKSLFMSVWSTFKSQSAPKTAGFVILMALGLVFIYKKRRDKMVTDHLILQQDIFRSMVSVMILFSTLEVFTVVIMSGDSELIREGYLMGGTIDIIIILFISEVLHKMKSIGAEA